MKRLLIVALLLAGCSAGVVKPTDPNAPPVDPNAQAVAAAGDLGAIGCAAAMVDAKPADVAKMRSGITLANAVLGEKQPSVGELSAAITTMFPSKYSGVGAVLIRRINMRLNNAQLIDRTSVAFSIAQTFVSECQAAIGVAPTA